MRLHAPTVEYIRAQIEAVRSELPVIEGDSTARGSAVIASDVLGIVDELIVGLLPAPVCTACAAKAKGEEA